MSAESVDGISLALCSLFIKTKLSEILAKKRGLKRKHYDEKVAIALSEIKKSLFLKMSSCPDYDFSSFPIASDGRLSFAGSVLGAKAEKKD